MKPVSQLERKPYAFILDGLKFPRQFLGCVGISLGKYYQNEAELKHCIIGDKPIFYDWEILSYN